MTVLRTLFASSALLLVIALVSACQSVSFGQGQPTLPWPQVADRSISIACDSPQLAQSASPQLVYPGLQWYDLRNEALASTPGSFTSPTFEAETTYTYDNQYSANGHVYNYYNSNTYRVRARQGSD
jgi:hypothetical protein